VIFFQKEYLLKKQNILSLIFVSLMLTSCGLLVDDEPGTANSESTPETTVETKLPEMKNDAISSTDDLFKESAGKEPASATPSEVAPEVAKTDAPSNITITPEAVPSKPIVIEEPKPVIIEEKIAEMPIEQPANKLQTYRVQKGETLMQIAFKIYGDISKWKDLKHMNGDKLSSNHALAKNMQLKYMAPATQFVWRPQGSPYLIKTGETLGSISTSVYQTPRNWKKIWENNKPLIKNPNIIYAGFTLYYKSPAELSSVKIKSKVKSQPTSEKDNSVEINNIDEEINNIQSATEKETIDISPLAE
jgi:nucleoid-associated protein YgaU